MRKEQFLKYMDILINKYKQLEDTYDTVTTFTGTVPDKLIENTNIQFAIDMLAEWMRDDNGWIDWFINEKECGNNQELTVTDINGNLLPSETIEDIWNLITEII